MGNRMTGILLIGGSIAAIVAGIRMLMKASRLRHTGIKTTADVIHVIDGRAMIIRFYTSGGAEHVTHYDRVPYGKGRTIELIYNPQKPDEIEMADPVAVKGDTPYFLFVIGVVGIVFGVFLLTGWGEEV